MHIDECSFDQALLFKGYVSFSYSVPATGADVTPIEVPRGPEANIGAVPSLW